MDKKVSPATAGTSRPESPARTLPSCKRRVSSRDLLDENGRAFLDHDGELYLLAILPDGGLGLARAERCHHRPGCPRHPGARR